MKVRFSTNAREDRREAEDYYRGVSDTVLHAFRRELTAALQFLMEYPEGAPVLEGRFRAKVVRGFPYSVVYRISDNELLVVAVANQHRDPMLLLGRLR